MFPVLSAAQIEVARRFASGPPRRFEPGAVLVEVGDLAAPIWLVLAGSIEASWRDGLGHETAIGSEGSGQFSGEISQLGAHSSLVVGRAGPQGCTAIPFDSAHLRALIIGSAGIGEIVMRAFIRRRVGLIETDRSGSILIGHADMPDLVRLQGFLTRNGYPVSILDASSDSEAHALVERLGIHDDEQPLLLCPNGTVLRRPTNEEAGRCLGLTPTLDPSRLYDVAVVGAGPAGLATAVYAASEGLSVLVLDQHAIGGQAGASARIENYLGFPTGISGQALAGRAFNQAQKFGAEMMIPVAITSLDCSNQTGAFALATECGQQLRARSIVVASGARYRRPEIENLAAFEGRGIWYWASPIEGRLCANQDIVLVGGGNSAGQAAVFLSGHARKIYMIIRGGGLGASMSRYLIERIEATDNIELIFNAEVVGLEGDADAALARVRWRSRLAPDEVQSFDTCNLFLFVGADPATGWLDGCGVKVDRAGFVLTGVQDGQNGERPVPPLETSVPGVFAVGDVRSGSVKRVGGAIGEGAQVVAALHGFLGDTAKPAL